MTKMTVCGRITLMWVNTLFRGHSHGDRTRWLRAWRPRPALARTLSQA